MNEQQELVVEYCEKLREIGILLNKLNEKYPQSINAMGIKFDGSFNIEIHYQQAINHFHSLRNPAVN